MTTQPNRHRPALWAALAAGTAAAAAYAYVRRQNRAPLPTVARVDLARYAGLWYEVARLPAIFEKGCQHVTAEYTLRPDGKVQVRNTCHQGARTGPAKVAAAVARAVDATNAKLKVQFFWPFEGDYWVLDLDAADYQYALVGAPNRKYLWLLSRQPQLAPGVRNRLVARGRALGFPVDKLLFTA